MALHDNYRGRIQTSLPGNPRRELNLRRLRLSPTTSQFIPRLSMLPSQHRPSQELTHRINQPSSACPTPVFLCSFAFCIGMLCLDFVLLTLITTHDCCFYEGENIHTHSSTCIEPAAKQHQLTLQQSERRRPVVSHQLTTGRSSHQNSYCERNGSSGGPVTQHERLLERRVKEACRGLKYTGEGT